LYFAPLEILIFGVYGNIKPPAFFNGDKTGLVLKLDQLARLNLTRQSLSLASPPNDATALTMSPIASAPAGMLILRIAPTTSPELIAVDNADPKFAEALTNRDPAPTALVMPLMLDDALRPSIILIFFSLLYDI
jgi:hypothetical protein